MNPHIHHNLSNSHRRAQSHWRRHRESSGMSLTYLQWAFLFHLRGWLLVGGILPNCLHYVLLISMFKLPPPATEILSKTELGLLCCRREYLFNSFGRRYLSIECSLYSRVPRAAAVAAVITATAGGEGARREKATEQLRV